MRSVWVHIEISAVPILFLFLSCVMQVIESFTSHSIRRWFNSFWPGQIYIEMPDSFISHNNPLFHLTKANDSHQMICIMFPHDSVVAYINTRHSYLLVRPFTAKIQQQVADLRSVVSSFISWRWTKKSHFCFVLASCVSYWILCSVLYFANALRNLKK